jgi:hypothetical protein
MKTIEKIHKAILANFALTNKKTLLASGEHEENKRAALEMFYIKALEFGIKDQVDLIVKVPEEIQTKLLDKIILTKASKRQEVKSKLIDNYLRMN